MSSSSLKVGSFSESVSLSCFKEFSVLKVSSVTDVFSVELSIVDDGSLAVELFSFISLEEVSTVLSEPFFCCSKSLEFSVFDESFFLTTVEFATSVSNVSAIVVLGTKAITISNVTRDNLLIFFILTKHL
ncbi:hypothetical protein [Enterococcus faecalis]|uniref:hypothetical protein n=1 Tax=Enterococcus faecalis TaxID=1351 RepID=UPI0036D38488